MTFSTSWMSPGKISSRLVGRVARLPARVRTKLLAGFLTIAGLLIVLGAVDIQVLSGVNDRTDELIRQQRKIAAYRLVQQDTTSQLYSISTALLLQDEQMLDAALRQLNQFGYDLDRMEFVAQNEAEILAKVLKDYEEFIKTVTRVVELIRDGRTAEARETQRSEILPLADRLERQTNQLVNIAEADMVAAIDATARTYQASRVIVIVFAVGSLLLALGLGYVISLSLIAPVREIEKGLRRIAAGEFGQRVEVANRDELGELADNVNQTSEQLGRLYLEIEARNRELSEALEQQTATGAILRVIAASPTDIQPVLNAVAENAAKLCEAYDCVIFLKEGESLVVKARYGSIPIDYDSLPVERGYMSGRAFLDSRVVHLHDASKDTGEFVEGRAIAARLGYRTVLAVPLLRDGESIGVLSIVRIEVQPFSAKRIELLTTFAAQAVIAINNASLFEEVQARTAEVTEALEYQTATSDVLGVISRSPNELQPVLEAILDVAVRLCRPRNAYISLLDPSDGCYHIRSFRFSDDHFAKFMNNTPIPPTPGGSTGRAALLGRAVYIEDTETDLGYEWKELARTGGVRSIVAVPMVKDGVTVGVINLADAAPRAFSPRQVELLETFAAQAVIAINNARLFSEIEEKSYQLEIASRHKSQFLANMSHELRTPLNSIMGFSEMLADGLYGQLPEKAVTTLARIQANGKHLLGLINDVLDLSKIEAGQLQLAIDSYSPGQIVKAAAAAAEPLARAKNLALNMVIAESMPLGRGDERRLTQVLLNLVGNAVKFTDHGTVEITAQAINGSFEFTVRDTGPGIPPEFQSRIFEEFQQVDDSSTRKKGGTGLGLAISKRIVEMHGGTIGVESTVGVGSEFKVTIPVRAEQKTEAA